MISYGRSTSGLNMAESGAEKHGPPAPRIIRELSNRCQVTPFSRPPFPPYAPAAKTPIEAFSGPLYLAQYVA